QGRSRVRPRAIWRPAPRPKAARRSTPSAGPSRAAARRPGGSWHGVPVRTARETTTAVPQAGLRAGPRVGPWRAGERGGPARVPVPARARARPAGQRVRPAGRAARAVPTRLAAVLLAEA